MLKDLIIKSRSCRRFIENERIDLKFLKQLIDLARISPSGANLQPLKYIVSNKPSTNKKIFPNLAWAGYLTDWEGPQQGERPSAYIIVLGDTSIKRVIECDHGIAAQTILLGACEQGVAGCIIGSINRKNLHRDLKISSSYEILLILALGRSNEKVKLETVGSDRNIKYWRDENGVHHVPKRKLKDIILKI